MTGAVNRARQHPASEAAVSALAAGRIVAFAAAAIAAFALYWATSFILEARNATAHFGADTWYYSELAEGDIFGRVAGNQQLDRIARFHPATVVFAAIWMKIFAPLTAWLAPLHILKAMFAAIGAAGVCAALSTFSTLVARRYVLLCAFIYAVSLGVWYFASIQESKIVTASLSAIYIAVYLQLRERWTMRGAVLLTVVLLAACLNEVVSGFLVVIPAADALLRDGWHWRNWRWTVPHALSAPLSYLVIEGVLYGRWVATLNPEGDSHFKMFIGYIVKNEYTVERFYAFAANWLFFNIAAPTPYADRGVPPGATYNGYFDPSLLNYLYSPASAVLALLFVAVTAAMLLPRFRARVPWAVQSILWALMAYAVLRGAFFFLFNPREPLLFSPAVALAHLLVLGVLFTSSGLPAKRVVLAGFAVLLFISNGLFILGR